MFIKAVCAAVFFLYLGLFPTQTHAQQWVAAWVSSQQGPSPEDETISNATVRLVVRSTVSGDRVRVRLENTFGINPLVIAAASIGLQARGPSLVIGSGTPLFFNASATVTIPAGDVVMSDPVRLPVQAEQGLAVSLYIPHINVRSSVHSSALTTSYLTNPGDGNHTEDENAVAFAATTTRMHWLSAVEVFSSSARGVVVALGDSITDGSCATVDGHDRWQDVLYGRLVDRENGTASLAVINAGIGGNTLIREGLNPAPTSLPVLERLERDVLSLAGITHVILFIGTNDIRRGATAKSLINGMKAVSSRLKALGIRVLGATIIPRNPEPREGLPSGLGFDIAKNAERRAVNEWIRGTSDFSAVIDFDAVMSLPSDDDLINPIYDCDGIHPNVFGYLVMGRSIDLTLFE